MNDRKNNDKRVPLGRASRETLGANFGVPERIGLQVLGAGLSER